MRKFGQHQPLNRQAERYAREGVDLSLSTLADQLGAVTELLMPLHRLIEAHVLAADRLHGDDTTVPLLARGGTKTARLWTYLRDDRPFAGTVPPAVIFKFSRDRGGEHPTGHLKGWTGILQADAYAGYNQLYDPKRRPAPVTSALCWSHARRKFFELADVEGNIRKGKADKEISPIAFEAVRRINALFDVERDINGFAPADRLEARQRLSAPLVEDLQRWLQGERALLSKHAKVAKAIDYLLSPHHWPGLHGVPSRWARLPDEQCRRTSPARRGPGTKILALRRVRTRRAPRRLHVFHDRHRQAQRHRSTGLARRHHRQDIRPASLKAA